MCESCLLSFKKGSNTALLSRAAVSEHFFPLKHSVLPDKVNVGPGPEACVCALGIRYHEEALEPRPLEMFSPPTYLTSSLGGACWGACPHRQEESAHKPMGGTKPGHSGVGPVPPSKSSL